MKGKRLSSHSRVATPASGTTVYINYSPVSKKLEVMYARGAVYHYKHVEPEIWEEYKALIKSGGSSGNFVNERIKPFYDYTEVK